MGSSVVNSVLTSKWTKVVVFLACLIPAGVLIWRVTQGDLTANPIEFLEHWTGDWTIRFLIITLCVTPLRKIVKMPQLIRFRRMLGLFAFFYACLHFSTWVGLDRFFNLADMWADVEKRKFITVGFAGFVLLIPLAVTSTKGWIRRLGGKKWQWLHRAIYISAILGVIHYAWLVKSDEHKPLQYAAMVGVLLLWRIGVWVRKKWQQQPVTRSVRPDEPTTAETA
ncbi:MAG TPA: protein-methionine-sulfoxide reductase heme-binding subunit MsrQ [Candidatus Acidoferrales bacterium]|nr:protein-methionine-sulfoxide reductase heme-binding subunit MsrQ [Candidatus Acidoferrales bacterium]